MNPFAIGIYSDRYLAIDSAGNQSTKIRWVIVGDTTPPTITSDPLIVKVQLFSKIDLTKYLILRDNYSSPDLLKDSLKVFFSDVNFNQVGNYAIEYITNDQSGNFSNECLQLVVVTRYISVEDMEEKSVSISPNPTTYSFKVAGISNSSGTISLFSSNGEQILSQQISSTMNTVNTRHLKPGIYQLVIKTNNGLQTRKVIIQ